MKFEMVSYHRACGRRMTDYSNNFVRCEHCDSLPCRKSEAREVELRKVVIKVAQENQTKEQLRGSVVI